MRLAEETVQLVWAGTARLAVAVVGAVRGSWSLRDPLLAQAEHTALQMPNASSSLLAGAQLVRGIGELGLDHPEQAYGELSRIPHRTIPPTNGCSMLWSVSYLAEAAVRAGRRDVPASGRWSSCRYRVRASHF